MFRKTCAAALCAAGVAALGASALPATALAASHPITWTEVGHVNGSSITGTISGGLKGTYTAKIAIPNLVAVLKVDGGTINVSANTSKSWTVTGGTGKYQNAKGSGTFSGSQATSTFTYKGTLSY